LYLDTRIIRNQFLNHNIFLRRNNFIAKTAHRVSRSFISVNQPLAIYFYRNIFHLLSFAFRVIKTAFKRVDHATPFARDGKHIQTPKRSNDSRRPDCTPSVYELDRREFPASFSQRIHPIAAPRRWKVERGLYFNNWANCLSFTPTSRRPPTSRSLHRDLWTKTGNNREVTAWIDPLDRSVGSRSTDVTLTNVVARKYYRWIVINSRKCRRRERRSKGRDFITKV